ncbi:unnamed protein product [Ixodes pacificus]
MKANNSQGFHKGGVRTQALIRTSRQKLQPVTSGWHIHETFKT